MDKPFKTIDEQIEILQDRKVMTDSGTADILLRENYYAIVNGYKDLFLIKSPTGDVYKPGTSFSEIYNLFLFDRKLRMLLFKYLAIAEASIKTVTAYHFAEAHQHNHHAYLELASYVDSPKQSKLAEHLIGEFKNMLGLNPDKRQRRLKPYIAHYLQCHREVPIWVLMNYLNFTQAIRFYDFQKEHIKTNIANTFMDLYEKSHSHRTKITHKTLLFSYDVIKDMRNICAHDERLYCARVSPGNNVTFKGLVEALDIVLPYEESEQLHKEILTEISSVIPKVSTVTPSKFLKRMGLKSLDDLIFAVG